MALYLGSSKVKFNNVTEDNSLIERTASIYRNSTVSEIRDYAFWSYNNLVAIDLSQVMVIKQSAFRSCSALTYVNLPQATTIGESAFYHCDALPSINLPQATVIGIRAFRYCSTLTLASLPQVTNISAYAFANCYNLLSLYLLGSSIPTLNSTAFDSTPIAGYTTETGGIYGSIYVPASLYSSYLTATNWSLFSAQIISR